MCAILLTINAAADLVNKIRGGAARGRSGLTIHWDSKHSKHVTQASEILTALFHCNKLRS